VRGPDVHLINEESRSRQPRVRSAPTIMYDQFISSRSERSIPGDE
jgi:hypothetical protein